MKKALATCFLLAGCAGDPSAADWFTACKAVDTVTTLHLASNGGSEFNPVMRAFLSLGPIAFIAAQVGVVAIAREHMAELTDGQKAAVMAAGCVPGVSNALQAIR